MNRDFLNSKTNNTENISPEQLDSEEREMNKLIDEYIQHPDCKSYIENFKTIKPICEEVLKQRHPEIKEKEWSKNISINDAIKYAHQFLTTIDSTLADQFMNLVYQNNNNQKTLNILPNYIKPHCEKGKAYINYHDKIKNMITLLHEMIHAMEYSDAINTNSGYRYLTESPTLIIENLFSKWLVKNKIITQNDYNLHKEWRLRDSQDVASKTLMEIALIEMRKKGQYITKKRVLEMIDEKQHINNFAKREECIKYLMKVLINRELYFKESERYVIGQYISDKVDKSRNPEKEFLEIYNLTSNPNITPEKSLKIIQEKYQEPNIDR
ncbi:MAG: hypothetical protein HXK67_04575 [Clostridiales bacterium]|jgi:hypothetical protein|nr:hypothetical protein [Clostridiales bacterium]